MRQYQVTHGDYGVSYSLECSERKTLTINVLPDLSVVVKAPEMVAELRRIGILAVVVLATLIILALVLG